MKAVSVKADSTADFINKVDTVIRDGFMPNLSILFHNIDLPIEPTVTFLESKSIPFIASSTGGEFITGQLGNASIVALLLQMNPDHFKILWSKKDAGTTRESAQIIAREAFDYFQKPSILVIGSGVATDGEMIVKGIKDVLGNEATIFGGTASENVRASGTFVFVDRDKIGDGMVAIAFNEEKIFMDGLAVGGWEPIGYMRYITKSVGNVVYEFDQEPALDVLLRYLGKVDVDVSEDNVRQSVWSSNFQIMMHREDGTPVARTPMVFNQQERSIIFGGTIPEGTKFQFSLLPSFEVIDNAVTEFSKIKEETPEVDAMVMFSCKGREYAFGPYIEEEIANIARLWDAPLAGFLCYGEIGKPRHARSEFNNLTCSLVLLKEK